MKNPTISAVDILPRMTKYPPAPMTMTVPMDVMNSTAGWYIAL